MIGAGPHDFMNPILDAASQGRLVVFVGAGVSTISPTCLPSWWDVNERVVVALSHEAEPLVGVDQAAALAKAVRDRQQADRFPPEYQAELLAGRQRYNTHRPHSALGYRPPAPETRSVAPLSVSA